jgi:hypothetical protein
MIILARVWKQDYQDACLLLPADIMPSDSIHCCGRDPLVLLIVAARTSHLSRAGTEA